MTYERRRGSAWARAFAGAWSRLSIVWKVVTVLATLGIAVAFVLLLVALFRAEPERTLRVGDTAASGPFDFSFRKIACHKRRKDLPQRIEEIPFPIKGELCFAYFRIRNSSDASRTFLLPTRGSSAGQEELVIALTEQGYEARGDTLEAKADAERAQVLDAIHTLGKRPPQTSWRKRDSTTVHRHAQQLYEENTVNRSGEGKRGDPYVFLPFVSDSTGRNESDGLF
jgi:hypothetical protein